MTPARSSIPILVVVCYVNLLAQAKYSGGSGTVDDPYRIATAEDLMLLCETTADYDKHFIMIADIDLDPCLPGRKVFDTAVIVGSVSDQGISFTGTFDGNGHEVSHLTVVGSRDLGLFGELELGGRILDVGVNDVNVSGSGSGIGGLVGFIRPGSSVINCHSTGTVRGYARVGGLVGQNQGDVLHSYSYGTVSGHSNVGGLVGYNNNYGKIAASFSTSQVSGYEAIGGLAGRNYGSTATSYSAGEFSGSKWVGGLVGANGRTITSSYSTGSVIGTTWVGGLVGSMGTASSRVLDCYSTGSVSGSDNVGGLVGRVNGNVTSSFWDIETSSQTISYGGTGKTTSEMQTAATFLDAGWDFVGETENGPEDVWIIVEGQTYPLLSWQKYGGGSGEPDDPYLIYTAEHLNALGAEPNDYDKHFKLMADIDLSGRVYDRAVIAPDTTDIEPGFQGTSFTGVFDGSGHIISHLTIEGESCLGLFAQLGNGAEIFNLGLEAVDVDGTGDSIGGLVGWNHGTITNCYVRGSISGRISVGGLAGANFGGSIITYCFTSCTVQADNSGGGLVGMKSGPGMSLSSRLGSVSFVVPPATISDCYSILVGESHISGLLVGQNGTERDGGGVFYTYTGNCYASCDGTGIVQASGLVGTNWREEALDCFWDAEISGVDDNNQGGIPLSTPEMQTASTFLKAGWDFVDETANGIEDIWWIDDGNDYPRLWWELIAEN
jgi:hypothetical protein